jgi:hypothetical protein
VGKKFPLFSYRITAVYDILDNKQGASFIFLTKNRPETWILWYLFPVKQKSIRKKVALVYMAHLLHI